MKRLPSVLLVLAALTGCSGDDGDATPSTRTITETGWMNRPSQGGSALRSQVDDVPVVFSSHSRRCTFLPLVWPAGHADRVGG